VAFSHCNRPTNSKKTRQDPFQTSSKYTARRPFDRQTTQIYVTALVILHVVSNVLSSMDAISERTVRRQPGEISDQSRSILEMVQPEIMLLRQEITRPKPVSLLFNHRSAVRKRTARNQTSTRQQTKLTSYTIFYSNVNTSPERTVTKCTSNYTNNVQVSKKYWKYEYGNR
jgi:hypothetical protein